MNNILYQNDLGYRIKQCSTNPLVFVQHYNLRTGVWRTVKVCNDDTQYRSALEYREAYKTKYPTTDDRTLDPIFWSHFVHLISQE